MAVPSRLALTRTRFTLLNVASIGGVLCIAWVVAALVLHLSLIMFRTGSMSPEIPAGSLALVRQIPAAEARVGDVVTVDRPGQLPITHRVVRVTPTPDAPPGSPMEIVLKGDANPTVDPAPYHVATVRIVLWSQPGLARVVVWLGHPAVIGSLTLGTTALVMWMFWPRRAPARHRTT